MSNSVGSREASQAQTILEHLRTHGSITKLEALNLYGIWNSGGRVWDLKRDGHPIETRMIDTPNGKRVAEYVLVRTDPNGQCVLDIA